MEDAKMTVCVAAVCGNNRYIAVAADRQKINDGSIVSGTPECKIRPLDNRSCLIYSGLSTYIERIITGLNSDDLEGQTLVVAKAVQRSNAECLNQIVEERVLMPTLGVTYSEFVAKNENAAITVRDQYIQNNDLNVRSVVLGVDESGPHIIQATPTLIEGSAGFYAIGIGEELAKWGQRLLAIQQHNSESSVVDGLFTVCFAKTAAQELGVAMGKETDLAIQTARGLHWIGSPLKSALVQKCKGRIQRLQLADSDVDELEKLCDAEIANWDEKLT